MTRWRFINRMVLVAVVLTLGLRETLPTGLADDAPQLEADQAKPVAQFLTIRSPVDDVMYGKVTNAALKLQNTATKEKRPGVLVLEITPGTSPFHQVQGLSKFLTSQKLSNVKTIAWVPKTVTGNNVVLALACREIIMHPDAELGDIGLGKALDPDEQRGVLSIVENSGNLKVNAALARGMSDPQQTVIKVDVVQPDGSVKSRVETPEGLKRLRDAKVEIKDVRSIWEAGEVGLLTAQKARALDVLAVNALDSRAAIADLYDLPREAMREDPTAGEAPKVTLIRLDAEIEPVITAFIERQVERALASGSNLIIFEIESPGGRLLESEQLANMIADLDPKKVRTVAWIPKQAISGAAMIALGCDEIYLRPDAKIGDAGPIGIGQGPDGRIVIDRAPEKILSYLRSTLRILAEKKKRPPALAEAMADRNLRVFQVRHRDDGRLWYMSQEEIDEAGGLWIKGALVAESRDENLLTLSGKRAAELKLAAPPVAGIGELKERLGIAVDVRLVPAQRTWVDDMIFWLNTGPAMFLLVTLGTILIFVELQFPTGLMGILSAVCFGLFFWARFLGGTAGWLEVMLFVLGIACIGMEVFVIPGFGVFGVAGGLLVLSSLLIAAQTWGSIEPGADFNLMTRNLGTLAASIVSVVVLGMVMSKYLPYVPVFSHMILTPPGSPDMAHMAEPQLRPENVAEPGGNGALMVGVVGTASTMLRPAGKAQIDGRYVDVVTEGGYIPQGSAIEVVDVSGSHIVVRQA